MKAKFRSLLFVLETLLLNLAFIANGAPPTIDYQPQSQTVILHQQAAFGVLASGMPPLAYQWLKNGAPIPGATNDQIVIPQSQFSDEGRYSVVASNVEGSVTSGEVELVVKLPTADDLDEQFVSGAFINGWVNSIVVQPDGKILIGGPFSTVNDAVRGGIARLNADGTIDHTFMSGLSGAHGLLPPVCIQSHCNRTAGRSLGGYSRRLTA